MLGWAGCSLGVVALACGYLWQAEGAAAERAWQRTESAAQSAEQGLTRMFEAVDTLHALAQTSLALEEVGNAAGAAAVRGHLSEVAARGRFAVRQVGIVGLDGWMSWSSMAGTGPVWLGDREHVLVHLRDGQRGLAVSRPVVGRASGVTTLQASRPMLNLEGQLAGVAVASLDLHLLGGLLGASAAEQGLEFRMYRRLDGALLAGSTALSADAVVPLAPPALLRAALAAPAGHMLLEAPQGQPMLASWRAPPGLPVVAVVLKPGREALAEAHRMRLPVLAGAALAVLAGLLAALALCTNLRLRGKELLDPLTGLANRRALQGAVRQAVATAAADGTLVALLLLDVDRFRAVNETFGLPAGDAVLRAVAARLAEQLRQEDLVVRLGADEFVVLLTGLREAADTAPLAQRLGTALGRPIPLPDGTELRVTVSMGAALAPRDGASAEELLRHADVALDGARLAGNGRFRTFEPAMDEAMRLRREIELGLREALDRHQFELHYQPLFDLDTWQVSGFEALVRWRRPDHGLVAPSVFIPVAEQTGLIGAIGEWVLRQACADAAGWATPLKVAVNLSPLQFRDGGLAAMVAEALAQTGLPAERLELEITEGVLLRDTEDTLRALQQLRALGARIALDDFGTGYSSLSYLLRFPFDKVKIDRSFVGDLGEGGEGMEIVRAVIGMCRSLNIATCAEGVETPEQLGRLKQEGCIEAQGYLFSKPRPAADVAMLLEELNSRLYLAAA